MDSPRSNYLERAREARKLAQTAGIILRADLLRVAAQWEMLAAHAPSDDDDCAEDRGALLKN